jgi:predicted YcjX-like family ATPase
MQLSMNPEKVLEEFLAPLPAWMQRTLQQGFPSLTQAEISEWWRNPDEVQHLTDEYERILQQIPKKWREYRKRLKQEARIFDRFLVPKGTAGAPQKKELAQKAAVLQRQGMKVPQIAAELNKTLGEDNKTTADAVRKLLKRHFQSDKTQTSFASRT